VRSSSICSWANFNALRAVISIASKTSACISTAAPVQATKMSRSVSLFRLFTFATEIIPRRIAETSQFRPSASAATEPIAQ
jgi:hypothetical protein